MNQTKAFELIRLLQIEGIGPQKLKYLIKATDQLTSVWQIERSVLLKIIGHNLESEFYQAGQEFNPEAIKESLTKSQTVVVDWQDDRYPYLLKEITDAPPILFARGNLKLLSSPDKKLAVVGSRKNSSYGTLIIQELVPKLIARGIIIVSGLALGIDGLAHEATLRQKGKTIAVLGSSLDFIYPVENSRLAEEIIVQNGLIVSEFPPGTPPIKQHFPRRNRIIAGLANGVLVIEAAKDSGSLITANLALDYNRDVFAVPGEINRENSQGVNLLLKQGANLVTEADDILDSWQIKEKEFDLKGESIIMSKNEQALIDFLGNERNHINDLAGKMTLGINELNQLIVQLELAGVIRNLGGGYYSKI